MLGYTHSKNPVVILERCNFKDSLNKNGNNNSRRMLGHLHSKNPVVILKRCNLEDMNKNVNTRRMTTKLENEVNIHKAKVVPESSSTVITELHQKKDNKTDENTENYEVNGIILRGRKKVDYKEKKSIGTPEIHHLPADINVKVPIYKQQLFAEVELKNRKYDEYNFIAESDGDDDSDVSFHVKIRKKKQRTISKVEGEKLNCRRNHECSGLTKAKYKDKVNNVLSNILEKVTKKSTPEKPTGINQRVNDQNQSPGEESRITTTCSKQIFRSTECYDVDNTKSNSKNRKLNLNNEVTNINHSSFSNKTTKDINNCDLGNPINLLEKVCQPLEAREEYSDLGAAQFIEDSDDFDVNFGFDQDSEEERTKVVNRNVNIIHNIVFNQDTLVNISSPVKQPRTRTSWRCDVDYTRNPHFLQLKENSLPSLNQEPVLESRFANSSSNSFISIPESKRSPKQQTMLNYIHVQKKHHQNDIQCSSLFDMEEVSPVKIKKCNKENFFKESPKNTRNNTKRSILGVIDDNVMANKMSTPVRPKQASVPFNLDLSLIENRDRRDSSTLFGFNYSKDIIDKGNTNELAKPFRLEVYPKKHCNPTQLPNKLTQPVRNSELQRLVESEPEFQNIVEKDALESEKALLFEDIETPHNITRTYKARTKKKLGAEKEYPKNGPNCKLSKEARKWIKEFNEMCQEVDKVELEID